jgi:hypothetical protein
VSLSKSDSCVFLWIISSIRMLFFISENHVFLYVVIPLISGFSITNNDLYQKLCTMALVTHWSSLASNALFIWQHVAADLMFLNAMTFLKLLSLSIAFGNYLMWMVMIWMIWNLIPHQTPVTLQVVGVDPKSYFNSDMLLYMKFKMLSKNWILKFEGFVL